MYVALRFTKFIKEILTGLLQLQHRIALQLPKWQVSLRSNANLCDSYFNSLLLMLAVPGSITIYRCRTTKTYRFEFCGKWFYQSWRLVGYVLCFLCLSGFVTRHVSDGVMLFRLSRCPAVVRSSGQILLPRYLKNGLSNFDKSGREYSLAPTGDLIRLWRSNIESQGHSLFHVYGGEGNYVDAEASTSIPS